MNKVVCNLCGTSYPENAAQCPICGYARPAEPASSGSENGAYTYVKGGRFSKQNVKKRNQAAAASADTAPTTEKKQKKSGGNAGRGLVVVVILLLLAIVAVLGYIALRFFLPNNFLFEGLDNLKTPVSSQQPEEELPPAVSEDQVIPETESTEPDLTCKAITVEQSQLLFESIGAEVYLAVTVEPSNTVDPLTFSSSDTAVATVSDEGKVTAVGEGNATITVSCGDMRAECSVSCVIPATEPEEVQLSLNRKEITFNAEGQSWLLYDGEITVEDIQWSSDDESIASIQNGKVIAVANGDTTVYGTYNDQTVSCVIHCQFEEEEQTGSVSEASGDSNRVYKLYNPTGYADDVTLRVGEKFTLKLVDENKDQVTDAQWEIENSKICSYENDIVKALKEGTTKITATYEGVTYTCLVRVIEE